MAGREETIEREGDAEERGRKEEITTSEVKTRRKI